MRIPVRFISIVFLLFTTNVRAADPPDAAEPPKLGEGNSLDFTGRIEAATVEIRPRVTGFLEKIAVKEGSAVNKGDLLAELDDKPYKARLDEARAKLAVAKASLKVAKLHHDKLKEAVKKGIVDEAEFRVAEAEMERAQAMVDVELAVLKLAELNLSYTKLVAPIDGRIGLFKEIAGNLVFADGPAIVSIVAVDPFFVAFDLDEKTILKLRRDAVDLAKLTATVGLADEEGFPHKAVVDFIDPQVNASTGTLRVRGVLANPKGLMSPGMFVRVRLTPPGK